MIIRKSEAQAIDFDGLKILDYTSKLKEKSSFAVIDVPVNASHKVSWSKRSDKYYYVIRGEIDFTLNGNNHCLYQGDFCLVKKGDKFSYRNKSKKTTSLILVHTPNFELDQEVFK